MFTKQNCSYHILLLKELTECIGMSVIDFKLIKIVGFTFQKCWLNDQNNQINQPHCLKADQTSWLDQSKLLVNQANLSTLVKKRAR